MILPITCRIEHLAAPGEDVLILSLDIASAADVTISLAGLLYNKLNRIKFTDSNHTAELHAVSDSYVLTYDNLTIPVTRTWLEAVLGMLLDVSLNGWSVTAHLDQDFANASVTIACLPPSR